MESSGTLLSDLKAKVLALDDDIMHNASELVSSANSSDCNEYLNCVAALREAVADFFISGQTPLSPENFDKALHLTRAQYACSMQHMMALSFRGKI